MLDVMKAFGIRCQVDETGIYGIREHVPQEVIIDCMKFSDDPVIPTGPRMSGATKTALLCSLMTQKTTLMNSYLKTDVKDLVRFLSMVGMKVELSEKNIVIFNDTHSREPHEISFELTDCVSEVMTLITLAIHAGIHLKLMVSRIDQVKEGLHHEFELLGKMGIPVRFAENMIEIEPISEVLPLHIDVTNTSIQSDHHPFFALMLTKGKGKSVIREFVWKDRFAYVNELKKLGANLAQENNILTIYPSELNRGGQVLSATDTRAAAIITLGALTAKGTTIVKNIQHMHRGYANLLPVISSLGGKISLQANSEGISL
jgi:UDP-N-acetylglucosamine 1-carboxyvinyltransferase